MFWDAGFRIIHGYASNTDTRYARSLAQKWASLTGQWVHWESKVWAKVIIYSSWLVDKGADIGKSNSLGCTIPQPPAAHFIAWRVMELEAWLWESEFNCLVQADIEIIERFITLIMKEAACDSCICSCSIHGCAALVQMLKSSLFPWRPQRFWRDRQFRACDEASYENRCRLYSWTKIEEYLGLGLFDGFAQSIIRFETFTALELTHTCCKYQYCSGYFARFDEESGAEIREEEENLQALEELVEKSIKEYMEREESIMTFLRGYWRVRMDEVLQKKGDLDVEIVRKIQESGVVLYS